MHGTSERSRGNAGMLTRWVSGLLPCSEVREMSVEKRMERARSKKKKNRKDVPIMGVHTSRWIASTVTLVQPSGVISPVDAATSFILTQVSLWSGSAGGYIREKRALSKQGASTQPHNLFSHFLNVCFFFFFSDSVLLTHLTFLLHQTCLMKHLFALVCESLFALSSRTCNRLTQ